MAEYSKCPECGETNYQEYLATRSFDCGFKGCFDERRARCGRKDKRKADDTAGATDNRYRLALLDAAQVVDVIASDMTRDGTGGTYAERCRELARQMREFAGHSRDAASFNDVSARKSGSGLKALVRRFGMR